MRPRARLQLGQQVSHVGLHSLLREEETMADFPVDEALRDELEDFDLPGGRLLLELLEGSREGDDLACTARRTPLGNCFEAPRVVHVATEDLFALSSVHDPRIGRVWTTLYSPKRGTADLDGRRALDRSRERLLDDRLALLRLDAASLDVLRPVAGDEVAIG